MVWQTLVAVVAQREHILGDLCRLSGFDLRVWLCS